MRLITWNVRIAGKESPLWKLFLELQPDIALLQEIGSIPENVNKTFNVLSKLAARKTGTPQKFSTAILTRGEILKEISLQSEYDWVNSELDFFKGNFVSCIVKLPGKEPVNVISVYSPAWPVAKNRLKGIDVSLVKLKSNPDVWGTEILWAALKHMASDGNWIVGGDYNSSETFDKEWQDEHGIKYGIRSSGNREILDRMQPIGFTECLRGHNGKIIPTFRHSNKEIVHQIDHLFVTNNLYQRLKGCTVGDESVIFGRLLSDHLPIIGEFDEK